MGLAFSYDLDSLTTVCEVGLLVIAPPVVFLHSTYSVKHQMTIHWFVKCLTPSLDCVFSSPLMSWPNLAQSQDEVSIFRLNAGLRIWMWTQDVGRSQGKGWVLVSWSFQVPGSKLLVCNIFSPTFSIPSSSPHATPSQSNPDQILSGPSLSFCSLICIMGIYYVPWL